MEAIYIRYRKTGEVVRLKNSDGVVFVNTLDFDWCDENGVTHKPKEN